MARGTIPFDPDAFRRYRGITAGGATRGDDIVSLAELARETGISRQQLTQYDQGRAHPELGTLRKLADALNLPTESLVAGWQNAPLPLIRQVAGFSAEETAQLLGISRNTYRRLEIESILPRGSMFYLEQLSTLFGMPRSSIYRAFYENERALASMVEGATLLGRLSVMSEAPSAEAADEDFSSIVKRISELLNASYRVTLICIEPIMRDRLRLLHLRAETQLRMRFSRTSEERYSAARVLDQLAERMVSTNATAWQRLRTLVGEILPRKQWRALVATASSRTGASAEAYSEDVWEMISGSKARYYNFVSLDSKGSAYYLTSHGIYFMRESNQRHQLLYPSVRKVQAHNFIEARRLLDIDRRSRQVRKEANLVQRVTVKAG